MSTGLQNGLEHNLQLNTQNQTLKNKKRNYYFNDMMLTMNHHPNEGPNHESERATQRIAHLASNMRTVQTNNNMTCLGPTFKPGKIFLSVFVAPFRGIQISNHGVSP